MKKISMVINADDRLGHISPEIYGHFSEHLGRCIYNGIYVGENSPIPNTDGIRNDIIEALRNIKAPVFRWPGGTSSCLCSAGPAAALQKNINGRTVSAKNLCAERS